MMLRSTALLLALAATPALAQPTTRAALDAQLKAEFIASDIDKNGVLTMPEIERRTARMRMGAVKAGDAQAKILAQLWFDKADANKDGKISQTEYGKLFFATFDRYDKNNDGRISAAERAAAESSAVAGPKER